MGVVGCPRNCAEATVKDVGMVGQEGSWQVVVGGAAGKGVRKADLLITVETTDAGAGSRASCSSSTTARTRTTWSARYDFVERLGIEKIRKETVYARAGSSAGAARPPAQVEGEVIRRVAGTSRAASHAVRRDSTHGGGCHRMSNWIRITAAENIPPREGRAVRLGSADAGHLQYRGEHSWPSRTGARTAAARLPTASWRAHRDLPAAQLAHLSRIGHVQRPCDTAAPAVRTFPTRLENGIVMLDIEDLRQSR